MGMTLCSHGPNSNLLEHLREVCIAATNLEEKIICACHDAGKATKPWQDYIDPTTSKSESPHNHAATGGLLAALMIRRLNRVNAKIWSLAALHAGAAHHTHLGIVGQHKPEYCTVASDPQAKSFFLDKRIGIASLLPEIDDELFSDTWSLFQQLAPMSMEAVLKFNQWLSLSADDRLEAFLKARSILGRLCFQDHESAAKQSGKSTHVTTWQDAFPCKEFQSRRSRDFPKTGKRIDDLRCKLASCFHQCIDTNAFFYFLDAPTGLGKTETMMSAAEKLIIGGHYERIVFAVPQISIADQVYEEYFSNKDCVQIWNYIRQEKAFVQSIFNESPTDNTDPHFTLDVALQPFSESYNITTFNQVLLAMCHPLRTRCIKSIGLRDAVIIMDEFHKLPLTILPYFFRLAREYAIRHNCKLIFGSATPLEAFEYLGLEQSVRIPRDLTENIYHDPAILTRRNYRCIGPLTISEVYEHIMEFHSRSEHNLLAVLNLVSDGTWPLLQQFHDCYDPWKQLSWLRENDDTRVIVFLDGLVPPILRREIVIACKEVMKHRSVTLITTQMIEVGVDLDFDHAVIDYQGLAATIQRGGRVGREGRCEPGVVEVFSLVTPKDKRSIDILNDVQLERDHRMASEGSFADVARKVKRFWRKEKRFFQSWFANKTHLTDVDLTTKLLSIQNGVFGDSDSSRLLDDFFVDAQGSGALGVDFLISQSIAEIFIADFRTELLILKDTDEWIMLQSLVDQLRSGDADGEDKRRLNRFLADRKIAVSREEIIQNMNLNELGVIEDFDHLRCMLMAPPII